MSTTQTPANPVPAEPGGLFTAFQEQKKASRSRWAFAGLAAVLPLGLGVAAWALVQGGPTYRIITANGIKSVRGGMTSDQVVALLGKPLTLERDATGAECYRYGRPSMQAPSFLVYSVCYESGRLRDVKQQQYSAWTVDPETGTFAAPEAPAPAAPPSKG